MHKSRYNIHEFIILIFNLRKEVKDMLCKSENTESWSKYYRIPTVVLEHRIFVVETGYNKVPRGLLQSMTRDLYIIHYVLSGKGVFMNEPFGAGDGYIVVPNEKEVIVADKEDPYESCWIMFRGADAHLLLKECGLPTHNGVFRFENNAECIRIIQKNLADASENPFAENAKMYAAFYELLALHMEANARNLTSPKSDITENVARFIRENYTHTVKISELAEKNFISQSHLILLFHARYGVSPQEYLLSARIDRAKELLKNKEESIKSVALSVGIENSLYFSRLFKKKTGVTPTEFAKRVQNIDA